MPSQTFFQAANQYIFGRKNPFPPRSQGLCSSSVTAALASMTVLTQLLLWDKLLSSLLYLGQVQTFPYKGLTRIRPLSCGSDSSVGRALHRHRRGRGFESCSEPEYFSCLCLSSVTAAPLQPCLHQTQKRCVSEFLFKIRLRRETNLMQGVLSQSASNHAVVIKKKCPLSQPISVQ